MQRITFLLLVVCFAAPLLGMPVIDGISAEFNHAAYGVSDARPLQAAYHQMPQISSMSASSSDFSMEAMKSAAVDALLGHQAKLDAILAADLAVDCLNGSKLDLLKLKDQVDDASTAMEDQSQRDELARGMIQELKTAVLAAGMGANSTDDTMNGIDTVDDHLGERQKARDKLKNSVTDALNRVNYLWKHKCCTPKCGSHGSCNYAEGKCSCEPGFVGPSCDIACPIHQDNVCNLHGKCSATGKCECEKDYRGTKCEKACPKSGVNGLICHGKGTCEADGKCKCVEGASGAACDECVSGFWKNSDGVCQECPNGSLAPCNNRGTCTADGKCSCQAGFVGSACQLACPKNAAGAVCSGTGQCNALTGACECPSTHRGQSCDIACPSSGGSVCNGHGCSADGKCSCAAGFHGKACEIQCPKAANGKHCGGKGTCLSSGKCSCDSGWAGSSCDKQCPVKNVKICAGHGKCDSTTGACKCASGFFGTDCGISCPRDHRGIVCAAHGTCSSAGKCSCTAGFKGNACQHACPRDAYGVVCGGKGTCEDSLAGAKCVCKAPYIGTSCTQATYGHFMVTSGGTSVARECPGGAATPCSGKGKCLSSGRCHCHAGYLGHDCSIKCSYHESCAWTGCGRGCSSGQYSRGSSRCGWGWRNKKHNCCQRIRRCTRIGRTQPHSCSWTSCSFGGCPSGKVETKAENCGWKHLWANKELCCFA